MKLIHNLIFLTLLTTATQTHLATAVTATPDFPTAWQNVTAQTDDQKFASADSLVTTILRQAQATNTQDHWARALVERMRLRNALGAPETALRDLRQAAWPQDPMWRSVVELYYAQAITQYHGRYSHEIRGRELVAATDSLDLKAWTNERFSREANGAFARVWAARDQWSGKSGGNSIDQWSLFLVQNNYPPRIRGTLRDAVTYLWVEQLANTSFWLPGQQEDVPRLDLAQLLAGATDKTSTADLSDPNRHPAQKISRILTDLRDWHLAHDNPEAALEAELENLRRQYRLRSDDQDRVHIRQHLAARLLELDPAYPWWSMGQWQLANFIRQEKAADSLVRARLVAAKGARRHSQQLGGQWCANMVSDLEAEQFSLTAMSHDAVQKPSVKIEHRNLDKLYFQAWRYDLLGRLAKGESPHLSRRDRESLMDDTEPALRWTVDLPATGDLRQHDTYTGLPDCEPGAYFVAASLREDFDEYENQINGVLFIVSDIVVTTQQLDGRTELLTRSGRTGKPLENVDLTVYRRGHDRYDSETVLSHLRTDATGRAEFTTDEYRNLEILARRNNDLAWLPRAYFIRPHTPGGIRQSFLYTDRAIYRPGQTVHWKVVTYQANALRTEFQTLPHTNVRVNLVDANYQNVDHQNAMTNDFGSAAGSFVIPEFGLLGNWRLTDTFGADAYIKVEQYKRPTFEAHLLAPEAPLQLNQPASLTGQVAYYFGSPVTEGQVKWRVTRHLEHLWSWGWGRHLPSRPSRVVATGETGLDENGRFTVNFHAEVDAGLESTEGVYYRYVVEADVVDNGGETRSTKRVFKLGFVAIEARITDSSGFLAPDRTKSLTIARTDLNKVPQPGKGRWTLHRLQQPPRALLPAEQPKIMMPDQEKLAVTAGDSQNPRWHQAGNGLEVLGEWELGKKIDHGQVEHGPDGLATVDLKGLTTGAYRLLYTTKDEAGQNCQARHDFVAVGKKPATLNLPLVLEPESRAYTVGETARFVVHSGLADQELYVQIFEGGKRTRAWFMSSTKEPQIIIVPVTETARRGLLVAVSVVRDHQQLASQRSVSVPWDNMVLDVEFATFRDRLTPGAQETFTVRIHSKDGTALNNKTTELLAYMYDRSLDAFASHRQPRPLSVFATPRGLGSRFTNLGVGRQITRLGSRDRGPGSRPPSLRPDQLLMYPGTVVFGRAGELYVRGGRSGQVAHIDSEVADALGKEGTPLLEAFDVEGAEYMVEVKSALSKQAGAVAEVVQLRQNFSETAFFLPHVQLDGEGHATIEYKVPDSVTDWNIQVHALTRDLHSGSARRQAASVKDLMVRPYLPRFLREGDAAEVKVVVNNAGTTALQGQVELAILDQATGRDLGADFGLADGIAAFAVEPGAGSDLVFRLRAPARVGAVTIKVVARSPGLSDGEQRSLPILPGRVHLTQSRFVALVDVARREMQFPLMADTGDATRIDDQLIVTIDAQLFGSVLSAVPYLVDYPYQCAEQTLNRYLSTSILAGVFAEHPEVRRMAEKMSGRKTQTEAWVASDPNRRMLLEETPWLRTSQGNPTEHDLINVLDAEITTRQRQKALDKLAELQDASGGFPWFPGGRPRPHLTLYILQGFARGAEFGVEAPAAMVQQAWRYLRAHYEAEMSPRLQVGQMSLPQCTMLNYLLSSYDQDVWRAAGFTADDRRLMLAYSFDRWRDHSILLKGYLALTLLRADRADDARLVYESVMNAAKTDVDLGTYWAPEDRAWLWYNDSVESHAFSLRVLTELAPDDPRRAGLVQWLLMNKKLGHWKSTRATAEAIYALVHFMQREGTLTVREEIAVQVGSHTQKFVFDPEEYTGRNNQIVFAGEEIDPQNMATVVVEKSTPGFAFASATWHFSTEQMPDQADGDLFGVTRQYFRRHHDGTQWVLTPLSAGDAVAVGDQVEVQLSVTAKQAAEYVHLRDPRGAGFEPESATSGYRWGTGLGYYEEVRDSGANFFFSRLPTGQYTMKYRLRASMAGEFKVGPATMQSMYAPEFAAYSAGAVVRVGG